MKKNIETIEKIVKEEKITYVACDGTEFKDEEDCKKWEASYKCTLQETLNKMPKYHCPCCEFGIAWDNEDQWNYIVVPQTEKDIVTLNAISDMFYCSEKLDMNNIGEKILMSFWYCCEDKIASAEDCYIRPFEKFKQGILEEWEKAEKSFETEN